MQDVDAASKSATYTANISAIDTYIASQPWSTTPTAVTSNSGLYFALTTAGSSTVSAAYGQELEFTYTLSSLSTTVGTSTTVVNAKIVDTVYSKTPLFIPFKKGILKAGVEEGLLLMHEGDKAILLMPSILAFGDVGSSDGVVPGNTPVRYDITLNRARTEDQQIEEYVPTTGLTLTQKTSTGLRFFQTKSNAVGMRVDSAQAKNLTITIKYVAKQLHAKTAVGFDSTSTGLNLYSVAGFTEGIAKLRVGEKATFIFPSSLGYSSDGLADKSTALFKVSPYAPLRYDVEVVSAQ
ncbi:FKBP-type peptidyl-prolyl cis-trans isomerase [Spirosoma foliorum]|nr:FKBP-type peptidyl-prolyl cis-trans isomerase [Spirosoma foliorum]